MRRKHIDHQKPIESSLELATDLDRQSNTDANLLHYARDGSDIDDLREEAVQREQQAGTAGSRT